eukprot:5322971-Amphidinium_carterae.1
MSGVLRMGCQLAQVRSVLRVRECHKRTLTRCLPVMNTSIPASSDELMKEECDNRLVTEWVKHNKTRRLQAEMKCTIPRESLQCPTVPVPPPMQGNDPQSREMIWRVKKMKLIIKDCNAEVEA